MKEINLKYLAENFLTLDEVAERSSISTERIEAYIKEQLIPEPSYKVHKHFEITSPLNDSHKIEDEVLYFPKSYVDLLKDCEKRSAEEIKKVFIGKMRQHLKNHKTNELAYENAISDENKLEHALENEWTYFQKGIYGICTLKASPQEIIEKEVAVKKLLEFLDTFSEDEWKGKESELTQLIDEYDEVSNLFAPYQRESSSRGKYVDKPLQRLELRDKIKKY